MNIIIERMVNIDKKLYGNQSYLIIKARIYYMFSASSPTSKKIDEKNLQI